MRTLSATHRLILATSLLLAPSVRGQNRPASHAPRLNDVVQINCVDGVLKFDWDDEQLAGVSPVTVQGPEAAWVLSVVRSGVPVGIAMNRVTGEAASAAHFWNLSVSVMSNRVRISANRGGKTPRETRLTLTQRDDGSVRLMIAGDRAAAAKNLTAANLLELRIQHPEVVNELINPILEQLGYSDLLSPGATDVYRVFDDISPDDKTIAAVRSILPRLSAAAFAEREAASGELQRLGPAAVLVLLKLDRSDLTPEAHDRIEQILSEQSRRRFDDARAMRSNVAFLADCLDFNDDRVRKSAMARIEQLTGWKVPPADWAHPGDYVRGKLAQKLKSDSPASMRPQ